MMPPHGPLTVVRLAEHFGQYVLTLKCSACGYSRTAQPKTLAHMTGWNALLVDIVRKMHCSNSPNGKARSICGQRRSATVNTSKGASTYLVSRRENFASARIFHYSHMPPIWNT